MFHSSRNQKSIPIFRLKRSLERVQVVELRVKRYHYGASKDVSESSPVLNWPNTIPTADFSYNCNSQISAKALNARFVWINCLFTGSALIP
jgi:hypothetical protein